VGESDDEATKTTSILAPVLWHSGVMQRLQELQSTLDGTDISHLAQHFAIECPDVQVFDYTLLPQPSVEELREFIDLYLSNPHGGKTDKWSLRESLIAYALSATFKDCSVFITSPLVSTSDGWKLDEPQATVKVIDLDLKPLANMRKWYDLDEKIWKHWHAAKVSNTSEAATNSGAVIDSKISEEGNAESRLATPVRVARKAIPSRLASSSTEALFQPTPDRQLNGPMESPVMNHNFGNPLAQDTSSTRAMQTKTPEHSQPTTPKAAPPSAVETPASMSLSDALFISPSAAAKQNATPASMSLSDALFISPSATAASPVDHATPASMSFSDALFISPSAAMAIANEHGRRGSNFGLEESPMGKLDTHGHDTGNKDIREFPDGTVHGGLRPETPNRAARSPGPSPSPGLVEAASSRHANDSDFREHFAVPSSANEIVDPLAPVPVNASTNGVESTDTDVPSSAVVPGVEAISRDPIEGSSHEAISDPTRETSKEMPVPSLPSSPSAEDQQHFKTIIAGVTEGSTSDLDVADGQVAVNQAEDRPATVLAERQQHMRAVLAGVVDDSTAPRHIQPESATSPSIEQEGDGFTPPFVTPMTFTEDTEPIFPEPIEPVKPTPTIKPPNDEVKPGTS